MDEQSRKGALAACSARLARHAAEGLSADPHDSADARENIRFITVALRNADELPHLRDTDLVPMPPSVRRYLLDAFTAILQGEKPDVALKLRTHHRARGWGAQDERLLAEMVWQYVHTGMSETAAAKRVATALSSPALQRIEPYRSIRKMGWKSAKAAYDAHKHDLDRRHGITRKVVR